MKKKKNWLVMTVDSLDRVIGNCGSTHKDGFHFVKTILKFPYNIFRLRAYQRMWHDASICHPGSEYGKE
ncbi:MAG: hypothetical protein GQ542_02050 [Desulforhopalus sp.]|nr:hypothetical protein [Desulforhopalus sp.]